MEPALQSGADDNLDKPVSEETFLVEFKKVAERVAQRLKEQPVIVAHSENTFDGSGIKRLLSNKFELDKVSYCFERATTYISSLLIIVNRHRTEIGKLTCLMFLHLQSLNAALENVPKDIQGKISKEYLRVALDALAPSAGLPPFGAVDQVIDLSRQF